MLKKLFLSTLCLSLGLMVKAEDTDVSQYENVVFPVSTTGEAGTNVTVSVEMNNTVEATGFQFDIVLPEGITVATDDDGFYLIELSEERTTSKKTDYFNSVHQPDGSVRVMCSSTQSYTFEGTSGEVCTIELNIGEEVADGDYPIIFKNIEISDKGANAHRVSQVEATLTVGAVDVNYDEGYAVKVLPFAMNKNKVDEELLVHIPITMVNETNVKSFEFDLQLPSSFITTLSYMDEDGLKITVANFTTTIGNASADGTISVSSVQLNARYKINAGTTAIGELPLFYEDDLIPAGVYPITIKNIKLTGTDGNTYMAAPYTTEIYVGDAPKATVADGVAAFHGDYGEAEGLELLKASLPEGATIDMTEVCDMAEDPSGFRTDNVIVTAETISYGRAMSNAWGSLCLPFALESDDNIQLYELTSASSSAMTFDPVASVEANTPVIFKASGDGFTVKAANDGFDTGFAAAMPKTSIEAITDWVLNGSYSEETIDVSGMQAYGLMNNEFHRFTKTLTAGAFRAWLQNNGEPMNATIRIEDSTEGISIIEQEDGSVKLIFDMQGRQLNDCPSHQIFIENGHKVVRTK